jgi:hypothetical protein
MARPRKNDPTTLLRPILEELARELALHVERFTLKRVNSEIARAMARKATRPAKRKAVLCYYPGCKNVAAPRFGMFCAALHKQLPNREKARLREKRSAA